MDQGALRAEDQPARPAVEFRSLPRGQQRRLLIEMIEQGRNDEEIGALLGMSQWQVRNLRYRLGIKKDRGGNLHLEPAEEGAASLRLAPAAPEAVAAAVEVAPGLSLHIHGVYPAEHLARRFEGLRALFEAAGPGRRYQVRLHVSERDADETGGDTSPA